MLKIGLLLLSSLSTVAVAAQHDGFYGGGFGTPPDFTYTQIELKSTNTDTPQGELWQPYALVGSRQLSKIQIDGDRLRFEVSDPALALTFDLVRSSIGYHGTALVKGKVQPASFVIRPGSPPSELLATYEGTYQLGEGRLLLLSRNNDTAGFWYLELPSGTTGYLFNLSNHEFVAGPCLYCVEPVQFRIVFDESTNGRATGLTVTEPGETPRWIPRAEVVREQRLTFTSRDGRQMAGTLYVPEKPGMYPGVVLVHGSGAQTRNGFFGCPRFLAEAYARAGIAAFAYDKQGTGESKGDWDRASLDALADDAAAAMEALRKHPEVDAERTARNGGDREFPGLSRYVPGFFEFVPQWAAKRLQAKRRSSGAR